MNLPTNIYVKEKSLLGECGEEKEAKRALPGPGMGIWKEMWGGSEIAAGQLQVANWCTGLKDSKGALRHTSAQVPAPMFDLCDLTKSYDLSEP